jgi:probable rRNA maturation factor|tara:strand:+ start:456 stop:902 length:447 start_codon:yes stop_codon:yes gene_type:complete
MIKANVILDFSKWRYKIKNPNIYFKKKLQKLSTIPSFKNKNQEFSILLTNSKKIRSLNYKFKKKNKPTDVLSFPTQNVFKNNSYIGDIAICFEIINKRSKASNFFLEFDKMWIHGYFHLIGYDHKKLKDFKKMSKKENLVLKYFHQIN